jgi:hypothetical protein
MSKHIHDDTQRRKQVKFRAPEQLVEEFDNHIDKSRAEAFRDFMRDTVEDADTTAVVPDDDELETVYRWLLNRAAPYDDSLIVNFGDVKSDLANAMDTNKDAIKRRYLRPLRSRGYLGPPTAGRFEVKPLDYPVAEVEQ